MAKGWNFWEKFGTIRSNMFNNIHIAFGDFALQLPDFFLGVFDRVNNFIGVIWLPIIIIWFINKFDPQIKAFIDRLKSVEGPGGFKATAEDQKNEGEELKEKAGDLEQGDKDLKKVVEAIKSENIKYKTDLTVKDAFLHFEKVNRLIFGSQIEILLKARLNSSVLPLSEVMAIYSRSGWDQRGYKFMEYIGFLINAGLVEFESSTASYRLTTYGQYFLLYLQKENISYNRNG